VPAPLSAASIILGTFVFAGCSHHGEQKVSRVPPREVLGSEILADVPRWVRTVRLPKRALAGARIFATSGCTNCHTYAHIGARNLGARDLTDAGRKHGVQFFERYVAHPHRFGNDVMPAFAVLGRRRLHHVAVFLAASRGER
jgi:hypothetical protein